jgi:uncharacterized protein (TIGR01777 family)
MDVVLSGASGLIGQAVTQALHARGDRVARLVRGVATMDDEIAWEPTRGRIDAAALDGFDAVVHLAGESIAARKWTDEQKRRILESRTEGTALLVGALATRAERPRVLVSASAIGYYGNRGDEVLTEDSTAGNDFLADVCTQWEVATVPAIDAGIRVVNVRSGIVLDGFGGALGRMLLPFKLGLGGRISSGRQWMSWIALDDEVGAILRAIDDDALRGPVNATAPNPMRNDEFTRTLGHVLHRPTILPTPLGPLRIRYGPELIESLLCYSQRVQPARLRAAGYDFRLPSLEAALRAVLHRPTA